MMKHFFTLLFASISMQVLALTIPQGTFYFDNSKTRYTTIKFVYGTNSPAISYVKTMTVLAKDTAGRKAASTWQISFVQDVPNMYRYTFAETSLSDGTYQKSFNDLKDAISNQYNEKRTATREDVFEAGQIFVPSSSDNWAQGSWEPLKQAQSEVSGTLPVLYIDTENGQEITSKDEYLQGTYRLVEDPQSEEPGETLPMEIKGRGNYTWTGFDKKPYRLKLESKASLLGMPKSKHWTLLAHADDQLGFLRNPCGFLFSEQLGLAWTPKFEAVELVLNGKYWGLYFLTEQIRIDKNRVNIVEQEDECTDKDSITGGWLIEIDNYYSDMGQIHLTEGNGSQIWATLHTPEILSNAQTDYITKELKAIDNVLYTGTDAVMDKKIDIASLVKFYIVQELLGNRESFHGSCYFYKDMGADSKWYWGPVWDFGNTFYNMNETFIYEEFPYAPQVWIGQAASHQIFQDTLRKYWQHWLYYDYANVQNELASFVAHISSAAANDAKRWPSYGNPDINSDLQNVISMISNRVKWLTKKWGQGKPDPVTDIPPINSNRSCHKMMVNEQLLIEINDAYYDAMGRLLLIDN